MVKTSFGSYEQFKEFFRTAPRNIQNILYRAYPQWARQLTEEYIAATKKISANKVKPEIIKETPKLTAAKDTVKGITNATKAANVGGKLVKGAGGLTARIAPIQGAINLFSKDSDIYDRLAGAGMMGTGLAAAFGATAAAPWAGALVVGDLLKKNVAAPVGEAIGKAIYGDGSQYNPDNSGLIDIYNAPDTFNSNLTPEQRAKVDAYNRNVIAKVQAEADASLARNQALQDEYTQGINNLDNLDRDIQNVQYGGDYTASSPAISQTTSAFYPQNAQDAQEGGLNINQDNLYSEPYKPSLKPIVEPVNYSNEYLASQNNLINQLYQNANQGEQQQMSINNPYDLGGLRPYAQIDNQQLAPVPSQQQGLDYGALLNQFNDAMKADQRQNQINQIVNAFGAFGSGERAPIYVVSPKGQLGAIQVDQPGQVAPLPTNTTSNYDKLIGQLKIQQAQQADALARQKQAAADLKAQQEYIANQNMMNALGKQFNVDPNIFANPDIAKAALQYVFNPNIQAQANIQETIGKAPTQATLKAAEQRGATAGKLDEIQLGKQYDAMIANIDNNAKLETEAMVQSGMDRRMAAQLATQRAINQYTQLMNNMRTDAELSNALQLQGMRGQNALQVANIYANRQGSSKEYDEQAARDKDWNTLIGIGTPIPQAIKYMQVKYPGFGLTDAERAEINRR